MLVLLLNHELQLVIVVLVPGLRSLPFLEQKKRLLSSALPDFSGVRPKEVLLVFRHPSFD